MAVLLLGVADSMAGSYVVLYASSQVGLGALQTGIFVSAPAAGSIAASLLAGRRFDRRPSRFYAVVALIAGAAGYAVLLLTTSYALMLIIGVVLLGAVGAAFPQLFALARLVMADNPAEGRAAPLLRSCWSLAWAVGPLLAAGLVGDGGFGLVLGMSAAVLALTAFVVLASPITPSARVGTQEDPQSPELRSRVPFGLRLPALSVALFFTAMYAGSVALPLYLTVTLERPARDVGLLYSVCAIVEVLAALLLALVPVRVNQKVLIVVSMVIFVGYFALTVTSRFELVAAAQIARGIGIAVVGAAGIRYFQDLGKEAATGRTTTLFANASTAGSLIAGVLAGISNQFFGYTTTLVLCGFAALLAAALFAVSRGNAHRPPRYRERGHLGRDRPGDERGHPASMARTISSATSGSTG